MKASAWKRRSLGPPLPATGEVHIWRIGVSERASRDALERLSADEKARADRFHRQEDRWRFTVGRAALRSTLGEYLCLDPQSLTFTYSETGKPALDAVGNGVGLNFNVAHSWQYALVAFAADPTLGIDIEHLGIERDIELLVGSLLSPSDATRLNLMSAEWRKRKLLQEWTRREAIGKALGGGIATALSSDPADFAGWSIEDIDVAENYVAAVAVHAPNVQLCPFDFDD